VSTALSNVYLTADVYLNVAQDYCVFRASSERREDHRRRRAATWMHRGTGNSNSSYQSVVICVYRSFNWL